mmetsp:Transcript_2460/g.6877  ORF Transcript_2460/g.6877 Transcript_2460/m.6877 type:complete len:245 (-) Transcript_2460:584-1318(-)
MFLGAFKSLGTDSVKLLPRFRFVAQCFVVLYHSGLVRTRPLRVVHRVVPMPNDLPVHVQLVSVVRKFDPLTRLFFQRQNDRVDFFARIIIQSQSGLFTCPLSPCRILSNFPRNTIPIGLHQLLHVRLIRHGKIVELLHLRLINVFLITQLAVADAPHMILHRICGAKLPKGAAIQAYVELRYPLNKVLDKALDINEVLHIRYKQTMLRRHVRNVLFEGPGAMIAEHTFFHRVRGCGFLCTVGSR